ncbi:putative 2-dehydropantoate [Cyphellophora attinorum]|uniref:2-dehydropantoate 2-reductase n=1 Tax=Cyphellophora attinorum TaxID=1664694 RepID=A0A0N1NY52_9EURO|nr:putative 2-dehydropantoate [Phialophora attinorum]KPI36554.1 putative 2-dehydropantoate [Phialophora attinorum]
MANILMFGTGSIGAVYTCILDKGGANVTCVCRSNYQEINENGIEVTSTVLGKLCSRPKVVQSVQEAVTLPEQPYDYVFVCTKVIPKTMKQTLEALHAVLKSGATTIVLIQNGLGIEKPYADAYPSATIISGVVYLPTTEIAPGVFLHEEVERLHLGLYGSSTSTSSHSRLESLATIIRNGGGTAVVEEDIQRQRWQKIIANGAVNTICALSKCRDRQLMDLSPLGTPLIKNVMLEIAAVAEVAGYADVAGAEAVENQLQRSLSRPYPGVQPSMLADVFNGKPLEVEAILGEIVRVGLSKQVSIPRLETLLVLLQGLDAYLYNQRADDAR